MTINWDFIENEEGESQRYGYVPYDRDGDNSGITVAMGVDLGHRSEVELRNNLRLSESLIAKLQPYLGLKGQAARDKIKREPLRLTLLEECEVNKGTFEYFERKLKKRWVSDGAYAHWNEVGDIKQTVIMSVYWHYGNRMFSFNFWQQVLRGDWAAALRNLRDFQDAYPSRRNREANYLELAMLY